jgi:WD40 repeat protein/serine/threonine protein kinase
LAADAPGGFCPHCLLGAAQNESDRTHALDTVMASSAGPAQDLEPLGVDFGCASFGDYELLEEIARGGMGVVYKARQKSLGRVVAVKMILAGQFATKQFVQRFRTEAAAAAVLQHPNIVSVHEVGVHEGKHFFSMDYVEGPNLARLVGNRPLPGHQAARYVKQIAEAVQYAHSQGILHRDLKPSNVLIDTATDQPRVTDFGLAKRLDGDSSLTVTGQVLGSPNFMPPEQASGTRSKAGRQSDVYGLGGILYFLLTARAPFQAESLEAIVTQVIQTEPISPRLLNPAVPLDLETICLKCLEKEPEKRYPTAEDVARELTRFLHDEPIQARPVGRLERGWRWCRRNPIVASLAAAVSVLLLTISIVSPLAAWRIAAARNITRQSLYAADMKQVQQAWDTGNARLAVSLLQGQIPQRGQTDLRGFEWRYFWNLCQGEQEFIFHGHTNSVGFVAFSADGRSVFSHSADGFLHVWDAAQPKDAPIQTTNFLNWDAGAALSADGMALAVAQVANVRVLDPFTLRDLAKWLPVDSRVEYRLGLSSDHRWLAAGCSLGELLLLHIASGQIIRTNTGILEPIQSVSVSSNIVAMGGQMGTLKLWGLREKKELPAPLSDDLRPISCIVFSRDEGTIAVARASTVQLCALSANPLVFSTLRASSADEATSLAFSPDGQTLSVGTLSGAIELWDAPHGRRTRVFHGHTARVSSLAFSPDGQHFVSGGEDTSVRLWNPTARAEENSVHLDVPSKVSYAAPSPDGRTIALGCADGTVLVCDMNSKPAPIRFEPHRQPVLALAYSPDGRTLASASGDERDANGAGDVKLWDLATGKGIRLNDLPNTVSGVAFSPEGTTLALACPYAVELWDPSGRSKIQMLAGHKERVRAVAFAPNGRILASGSSDRTIELWDVAAKSLIGTLQAGNEGVGCLTFSKDGRLLASSGDGLSINVWDLKRRKLLTALQGHNLRSIPSLAFSPDAKTLASGGADGTVRLWNLAAQREVATFDVQQGAVAGVFFDLDGTTLTAVTADGTVRWWKAPGLATPPGGTLFSANAHRN